MFSRIPTTTNNPSSELFYNEFTLFTNKVKYQDINKRSSELIFPVQGQMFKRCHHGQIPFFSTDTFL